MPRIVSNSLDPVVADPALFVDRIGFVEEFTEMVEAAVLDEGRRKARFIVSGAKGVGKTIFTRFVLRRLHEAMGKGFLLVEVDGRGLVYRTFLDKLAGNLVQEGLLARQVVPAEWHGWLRELGLLVTHDVLTSTATDQVVRQHGASFSGKGSLLGALEAIGMFQWTESRQIGSSLTKSVKVDDRLLAKSIQVTLSEFRAANIPTVVFYNDLDQAVDRESPEDARRALGRLVELEDCVQVLNVRTEVLYDDLRRESRVMALPELPPEALLDLYRARVGSEPSTMKRTGLLSAEAIGLAERLARVNGNPWAFLSWMENILRGFGADAFELASDDFRRRLVVRAVGLPDDGLLERAAKAFDTTASGWSAWCSESDLEGCVNPMTANEIQSLKRAGLLVARDIFAPEMGLRLEPLLDLLRPSVRERLA